MNPLQSSHHPLPWDVRGGEVFFEAYARIAFAEHVKAWRWHWYLRGHTIATGGGTPRV
jgi:hypothetical protein